MRDINFVYLRSVIGNNEDFKNKERANYLAKLNENNDFIFTENGVVIFFIETGGTEEKFKAIFSKYKEPYFLLATDANNSLPACLEIATFLKKENKKFHIFHGTPEEVRKQIKFDEIETIFKNESKKFKTEILENKKFGVIGKPSDWLIASDVNYSDAKEKLGVTLVDISSSKLLEKISKISSSNLLEKFKKYLNEKVDQKTLEGALKIYEAIVQIINEEKLNGITIRCFDLLDQIKNTSCLALALLNSQGYIATCEGDVPAMLTMSLIREMFKESSFQVNPSYICLEKKYAYFAHCTLPLDMCKEFSFDTHFESGIGIGIKGKLECKDVTILKINSNLENFEIFEGFIEENLNKNNLCRTQIKVNFYENIDEMFESPNGNHLVIFYGKHKDEFNKILSY